MSDSKDVITNTQNKLKYCTSINNIHISLYIINNKIITKIAIKNMLLLKTNFLMYNHNNILIFPLRYLSMHCAY